MATIKFKLQSGANPANIYVRLIDGRKVDYKAKTNFIINPADWSESKQRPKSLTNIHNKNLDVDLHNLRVHILNQYNISNQNIDKNWLKKIINPIEIKTIPDNLALYFDYYFEQRGSELSHRSVLKMKVVKNKIIKYEKSINSKISLSDVDNDFKNKFEKYNLDLGYNINTFYNNLKEIKTICFHAQKSGLKINPQVNDFKIIQKKTVTIYLDFDELKKIENIPEEKLISDNLKNTRDWLLISCYTGQRVSDFMTFSADMIRNEKEAKLIEFTQQKTGTKMSLPLHPKVIEILNKRNFQFPKRITDQKYNDFLKIIGQLARLDNIVYGGKNDPKTNRKIMSNYPKYELITSHIGRRSFATNYYGTIPTSLLMSATGHKTEAMFLVYIGKTNTDKAMQLNQYFNL
jgi:integrase